jgi:diguanylate cyclase (GGDEF)-like protein
MIIPTTTRAKVAVLLLIDPDPARQRETRDRLVVLGYTVRSADDYEAAIGAVHVTPPDVVLVSGLPSEGDSWNNLQTELSKWGVPVVSLGSASEALRDVDDKELKLRLDVALQSRTLQDALMTENARLAAERLHDPLTGLFNRRYIMIRVEEEILRSTRRGHALSCMLVDVDGFDAINEDWGHQTGDVILRDMAHLLTRTMRASDVCCRYRDDQFLVLLTDTDAAGAQIAANRARDAITAYNFFNQMSADPLKLTASVGVAYWQPSGKGEAGTWEPQLIGLAERALKAAKQSGKNRLVILQAT